LSVLTGRNWDALTAEGGAPSQCGWLKDKFGVSRVMAAMMKMQKIDIAMLQNAAHG
jgi:predicted 3-demethylubiquinone-9 3-methyltransferase (glyoxalase superfamily)